MSFKENVKIALIDNLQLKTKINLVVDDLKNEITRCINLDEIPYYAIIDFNDLNSEEINMLNMLITCNVGVNCDITDDKIYCKLSDFIM